MCGHTALALLLLSSGAQPLPENQTISTAPAISVISISANDLDQLLRKPPSADDLYAQALMRQIAATEHETNALSHLVDLTEQSIRETPAISPEAADVKTDQFSVDQAVLEETRERAPSLEPIPYEDWSVASVTTDAEQAKSIDQQIKPVQANNNARDGRTGIVSVSVDPLIVYQHQLISHIKLYLPRSESHVQCSVKLSLSDSGQILAISFNTQKATGCDAVRQAIARAGKLPGSKDPDVLPFLSSLELQFNHG